MAIPITVPRLGWNMEEGIFVGWLKPVGAKIRPGETLFTLETNKATEDVECLDEGILFLPENAPKPEEVVAVGRVIAYLLAPGESPPEEPTPLAPMPTKETIPTPKPITSPKQIRQETPTISPRAQRTAAGMGVDISKVRGTGRNGRIRERDVLAVAPSSVGTTRRIIAERMMHSLRSTAPVTLTTTIDATNLVAFRQRIKAQKDVDSIPGITDCFVFAVAAALQRHPVLNSRWENERIIASAGIHIGIAIDTEAGLLVPVVRDVPRLTLAQLAKKTRELTDRAKAGKLSAAEMQGGTFTISSLGTFGIDTFTPIINYPECAILGIGRIRRCPAVVDDDIAIRDQVALSLTFDHRITDGAPASRFLQSVGAIIESADWEFHP